MKKNKFKERIKLYQSFIKEKKIGPTSVPYYQKEIDLCKKIIKLLKEKKMTPGVFDKLNDRYKHDVSGELKNVMWCCESCGSEIGKKLPISPFFEGDAIECSYCGHELTRRTPGGQGNPFGYSFKKIKK